MTFKSDPTDQLTASLRAATSLKKNLYRGIKINSFVPIHGCVRAQLELGEQPCANAILGLNLDASTYLSHNFAVHF